MTKERKAKVLDVIHRLGNNHPLVIHFITLAEDIKITDRMFNDFYNFLNEKF